MSAIADRIREALSVQRHRLIRAGDVVVCSCGAHESPTSGPGASAQWREHLIEAVVAAVEQDR